MHRSRVVTVAIVGIAVLAAVMWYSAASYLTGGLLDVVVFAPPGATLGVASTWSAHAFAPQRFTWRRGMIGAVVGGLIAGPLIEALVAFTAAWSPLSFNFVFNAGALVALAGGLAVGGVSWLIGAIVHTRRRRGAARRHPAPITAPNGRDRDQPTRRSRAASVDWPPAAQSRFEE